MGPIEAVLVPVLIVIGIFAPSILIAVIGWRWCRKIKNEYLRVVARAGVVSAAFTPTIYGHAGPVFAVWMILIGQGSDKLSYGLLPIIVVWCIGSGLVLAKRWFRNRDMQDKTTNT